MPAGRRKGEHFADSERVTVRLRGDELAKLDELVAYLDGDGYWNRAGDRFHRNWRPTRSEGLRHALLQVHRLTFDDRKMSDDPDVENV